MRLHIGDVEGYRRTCREMLERFGNADKPDIANPAKDQFDRYQSEEMRLLFFQIILLSLLMIFSGVVTPRLVL